MKIKSKVSPAFSKAVGVQRAKPSGRARRREIPRRVSGLSLAIAALLLLAACGGRADPQASPGASAPVWAENTPEAVTEPPAAETELPVTPAPAKEPETTPLPTPPMPTEKNPEVTDAPVDDKAFPQTATLLQAVTAYDAEKSNTRTLSAGTILRVAAKAEGEWLAAQDGAETIWLRLDQPDGISVDTPNGWLFLWVVMDGLDYSEF